MLQKQNIGAKHVALMLAPQILDLSTKSMYSKLGTKYAINLPFSPIYI